MKLSILVPMLLLISIATYSQTNIGGFVLNQKKQPIVGANVYLKGTYAGTMTDAEGHFEFATQKKGEQTLVVSYVSFETKEIIEDVVKMNSLAVK